MLPEQPTIKGNTAAKKLLNLAVAGFFTMSVYSAQAATCPDEVPAPLPYADAAIALQETVAEKEIWECMGDLLIARNVVNPTLTPILPDPDKATGTAVVVAPGGGFAMLSMTTEGFDVAQWLAERGIAAFVLKYRLNSTPPVFEEWTKEQSEKMQALSDKGEEMPRLDTPAEAVADAAVALRLIRQRAEEWGVDPERVGMIGFSAGAMTTLAAGDLKDATARPDFIAPVYPPLWSRDIPDHVPPMFLAISLDDPLFGMGRPLDLINDWQASGRPFEAHLYERGGHGFGLAGNGPASALWAQEFYAWMDDRGLLSADTAYSVESTQLSTLLKDPAARAILDKYLPGITDNEQLAMAGGLSLAKLQSFAPQMIAKDKLIPIQKAFDAL